MTKEEEIQYFLFEDGDVSGKRFKERTKFWQRTSLWPSGYFPCTEQINLRLKLIKNSKESLRSTLDSLDRVLPLIKPHPDGKKRFGVFEHTLAEFGSYYIEISEYCYDLVVYRWRRKSKVASFQNLGDLVKYVQEHHYYTDAD